MKKNFVVEMDAEKICYHLAHLNTIRFCSKLERAKHCIGNLNERPEWCPLVPVREARTPYDLMIAEKWVKE